MERVPPENVVDTIWLAKSSGLIIDYCFNHIPPLIF